MTVNARYRAWWLTHATCFLCVPTKSIGKFGHHYGPVLMSESYNEDMNSINPSGDTMIRRLSDWRCIAGFAHRESLVLSAAAEGNWQQAEALYFDLIDEINEKHGLISAQMATAYENLVLLLQPQAKDTTTYRRLAKIIRKRLEG